MSSLLEFWDFNWGCLNSHTLSMSPVYLQQKYYLKFQRNTLLHQLRTGKWVGLSQTRPTRYWKHAETNCSQTERRAHMCSTLICYCRTEWPEKFHLLSELGAYRPKREYLMVMGDILLRGQVRPTMIPAILDILHEGHQESQSFQISMITRIVCRSDKKLYTATPVQNVKKQWENPC